MIEGDFFEKRLHERERKYEMDLLRQKMREVRKDRRRARRKRMRKKLLIYSFVGVILCGIGYGLLELKYAQAKEYLAQKQYVAAGNLFRFTLFYRDCAVIGTQSAEYARAMQMYDEGKYDEAAEAFNALGDFADCSQWSAKSLKERDYQAALVLHNEGQDLEAEQAFLALGDYEDSAEKAKMCQTAFVEVGYDHAGKRYSEGKYEEAKDLFTKLAAVGVKDSAEWIIKCDDALKKADYDAALELLENGDLDGAEREFMALEGFLDSSDRIVQIDEARLEIRLQEAITLYDDQKFTEAKEAFWALEHYSDAKEWVKKCNLEIRRVRYDAADNLFTEGKYEEALNEFIALGNFSDSKERAKNCREALKQKE